MNRAPIKDMNAWARVRVSSPDQRLIVGTLRALNHAKKWESWRAWMKGLDAETRREVAASRRRARGSRSPSARG
jgi:hypothetical protein